MRKADTKKYDFLVLGASGMQGKIVCRDLLDHGFSVFMADIDERGSRRLLDSFSTHSEFARLDVRKVPSVVKLMKSSGARVVINCVEGDWNSDMYKAALQAGVHILDLGSDIPMTREQIAMHEDFKAKDLVAITGVGSTPGVNNIMLHYAAHKDFDTIDTIEAGFAWDSNIKKFVVPFSIISIIEEYTEPAAYVEDGIWKKILPKDSVIRKRYREIGEQDSFIVRHPETFTFEYYYKREGVKTIRYYAGFPDHTTRVINSLLETGFGSSLPVPIQGAQAKPIEVLSDVLRNLEKPKGYTEKENLWVEVKGTKEGKPTSVLMECIVPTLTGWEDAGCNIDTGMPASIMAQMVFDGTITARGSYEPGIVVPEKEFFKQLDQRGMRVYENGQLVHPDAIPYHKEAWWDFERTSK